MTDQVEGQEDARGRQGDSNREALVNEDITNYMHATEEQGSGNDKDYGESDDNFDNTTGNHYDYDNDNVAAIVH